MTNNTDITYNYVMPGNFLKGSPFLVANFSGDRVGISITSIPSIGPSSGSGTLVHVNFRIKTTVIKPTLIYFNIIKAFGITQTGDTIKLIPTETSITLMPPTGVEEGSIPTEFELKQNFPNPFNPSTKISYSLPKSTMVDLSVYDINGEKVATLVNEFKEAGNYSVEFSKNNLQNIQGSSLSSGVYIYRIRTPDFTQSKKMLILK